MKNIKSIIFIIFYTIIISALSIFIYDKINRKEVSKEVATENIENIVENTNNVEDYSNVSGTIEVKEEQANEKQDYIKKHIEVYSIKAAYMDSLIDGRVAGLTFKIKNKGKKTLTKLEITFNYKNKNGDIIYDNSYTPINSSNIYVGTGTEKELKPNYIWQLESDKFYPDKKVPKEWKEGSIEYKITNIEF